MSALREKKEREYESRLICGLPSVGRLSFLFSFLFCCCCCCCLHVVLFSVSLCRYRTIHYQSNPIQCISNPLSIETEYSSNTNIHFHKPRHPNTYSQKKSASYSHSFFPPPYPGFYPMYPRLCSPQSILSILDSGHWTVDGGAH